MTEEQTLIAFENTPIRRDFDEATETWYFSIVDVIAVLSESVNPHDYWFRMKVRVNAEEGLELSTTEIEIFRWGNEIQAMAGQSRL